MAQADRTRQKAFGRLDTYLDENGGINDPAKAGGVHAQRPGVHHHSCNACMHLECLLFVGNTNPVVERQSCSGGAYARAVTTPMCYSCCSMAVSVSVAQPSQSPTAARRRK